MVAEDGGKKSLVPGFADAVKLIEAAGTSARALVSFVRRRWEKEGRKRLPRRGAVGPLLPLEPPEVWGFGVTYRKSAAGPAGRFPGRLAGGA